MGICDDSFDAEHLIAELAVRFARSASDEVTLTKGEFKQIGCWLASFWEWAGDDIELYRPGHKKGPAARGERSSG